MERSSIVFPEERLEEILKILKSEGKLKVKDLSIKFNVTEDCIRKDLKVLENKGYLKRTYGGAVLFRESAHEQDIVSRKDIDISSKTIIAQKAFDIIEDRETIFLDISTTNIILAKLLSESSKNITVVSNMLEVINVLSNKNNITAICIGGILNKNLNGFVGAASIELISKYKFDKTFIGSCGIDVFDKSITTFQIEDGITKSSIIKAGKKNYIVMEKKKFYYDGNYKFASLDDIDSIITDELIDDDIKNILIENGIEII
ncbi:DeoR/GlpR family DNA-binding transcription regulator [Caloramator sp. E03]|uniref:DeoR/GlpR family DNA-binding transcription regulator n=1 Tax=Caloramator sp. E03 TaxID=2576307 RepID=UPI003EC0B4C8